MANAYAINRKAEQLNQKVLDHFTGIFGGLAARIDEKLEPIDTISEELAGLKMQLDRIEKLLIADSKR